MEEAGAASEAREEAFVFLAHFSDLPDPRQPGKITYPLQEILLLCLLAVLAGAEASSISHCSGRHRTSAIADVRIHSADLGQARDRVRRRRNP